MLQGLHLQVSLSDGNKISVTINDDQVFNSLLKTLIQHDLEIYEIESQHANLEQIFINLISNSHD